MHVFVTVGSTRFDSLITLITSNHFTQKLIEQGYITLTIQHGKSPITTTSNPLLKTSTFEYTQSIAQHFQPADLIITHAGAGSILDALEQKKSDAKIIMCVNESLMDNHQLELAKKIYSLSLAKMCTVDTLMRVLDDETECDVSFVFDHGDRLFKHIDSIIFQ